MYVGAFSAVNPRLDRPVGLDEGDHVASGSLGPDEGSALNALPLLLAPVGDQLRSIAEVELDGLSVSTQQLALGIDVLAFGRLDGIDDDVEALLGGEGLHALGL